MDLGQAKEKYIIKTRIDFDDDYIVLREPTAIEAIDFSDDTKKNVEIVKNLLPSCIVEHSFTVGDKKATSKEVADFIIQSTILFTKVVQYWFEEFQLSDKKKVK